MYLLSGVCNKKCVGPSYCQAKMYASRIACCPLMNRGEYANETDGQTDGRQTVTLRLPLDAACVINRKQSGSYVETVRSSTGSAALKLEISVSLKL